MNIIQVYTPTGDKSDEEMQEFYYALKKALNITKRGEITIIMRRLQKVKMEISVDNMD